MRLFPVRNTLDELLVNVSNKGMRPLDLGHLLYYEFAEEYLLGWVVFSVNTIG